VGSHTYFRGGLGVCLGPMLKVNTSSFAAPHTHFKPCQTNRCQTAHCCCTAGGKNIFRGLFLAVLATFVGCSLLYTLPDALAANMNKVLPFWFYESQVSGEWLKCMLSPKTFFTQDPCKRHSCDVLYAEHAAGNRQLHCQLGFYCRLPVME